MSGTNDVKDMDYYLKHPDEMPTDVAMIEKIFGDAELKAGGDGGEPEPKKESKADEPAPVSDGGERIDGVLTKDGKHVIPYAEMERRIAEARTSAEAEAAARRQAEAYARKLEENVREMEARVAKAPEGGTTEPLPSGELPPEVMQTLKEEFPTIAKAIEAQQTLFKQAEQKLAQIEQRVAGSEKARADDVAAEVNELIAQVPDLDRWRREVPFLFDRAQKVEDLILGDKELLKKRPELATDDVARYKEVVSRVRQEVGLPADDKSLEKKSGKDAEKAEEVLRGQEPQHPRSLSDMPAGSPAANSRTEALDDLSAAEIGNRFMGMSVEQIQQQLARL